MSSHDIEASIITVTWNGESFLEECIGSLCRQENDLDVEVIVVDNASTDASPNLIEEHFPKVRLIRNDHNVGFSRANNQGIRAAKGRYLCLINSDVNVPAGCLKKMITYMDLNPTIGVLGPKMLTPYGGVGPSAMRFPSLGNGLMRALAVDSLFKSSGWVRDQLMQDFTYQQLADVDVLTGWFWVIRREALDQVGLLDERFFMYGEDIDWCKRFHQGRWRVVFYPEADALHYGGASSAKAPTRFYVELLRARMQYCKKHHGLTMSLAYWMVAWIHHLARTVGYTTLYFLKPSDKSELSLKITRSIACIRWLMGSYRLAKEEAQ